MAILTDGETSLYGSYTLTQQNNTKFTFNTDTKYVPKNIELTVNVRSAATPTISGGAPSGSVSSITGNNITLSDTNNGISVTASGTTSRAAITCSTTQSGWIGTSIASSAASSAVALTEKTRYITEITVPTATNFTLSSTGNTATDTSTIAITNGAYRKMSITNYGNGNLSNITNSANGTIGTLVNNGTITTLSNGSTITTLTNTGTITTLNNTGTIAVKSTSSSSGNLTVSAYNASGTLESDKSIVSDGKWVSTSVSAAGTYYGRVTIAAGEASSSFANSGISTYFNAGSSSSYNMYITPRHSIDTAGYLAAASNVAGTTSYYTIKTTSLTFSGGALNSQAANLSTQTNITTNTTTNNSGVSITCRGYAGRAAVTYTNASAGWYAAHTSATTASSAVAQTSWTGTTYYIDGVTLTKPSSGTRTFTITVPNGTGTITFTFSVDSSGNVTVTE